MYLTPLKISQMLAMRSINTSTRLNKDPVVRSCGCPEDPPKKGMLQFLKDPFVKKCGPSAAKPSKFMKVCLFGAKVGIAGGLVYWTYHQGMWTDSKSSAMLADRLKSAGSVLAYGTCSYDSASVATDCCEYGKDENEAIQRLKTAYCFLKLDSVAKPSIVEDAVYVGTLGDDDDFCRCDLCKPVLFFRDTSGGPPELKPAENAVASSSGGEGCEEEQPTRGEWIWNKWSSQNWSPKTCIFSKKCCCGDKTAAEEPAPATDEETPQDEDNNYYVDEYFIIRKDEGEEDKGKDNADGGKDKDGGKEAGGDDGKGKGSRASEGGADEQDGGNEEAAAEEEPADEEPAEEQA